MISRSTDESTRPQFVGVVQKRYEILTLAQRLQKGLGGRQERAFHGNSKKKKRRLDCQNRFGRRKKMKNWNMYLQDDSKAPDEVQIFVYQRHFF